MELNCIFDKVDCLFHIIYLKDFDVQCLKCFVVRRGRFCFGNHLILCNNFRWIGLHLGDRNMSRFDLGYYQRCCFMIKNLISLFEIIVLLFLFGLGHLLVRFQRN